MEELKETSWEVKAYIGEKWEEVEAREKNSCEFGFE